MAPGPVLEPVTFMVMPAWPVASVLRAGGASAFATVLPAASFSVKRPSFATTSEPKDVLSPTPSGPDT